PRTTVVTQAQGLAQSLNQASSQLTQIGANGATQLGSQIAQINSLLTQAATLNGDLAQATGTGGIGAAPLEDQMNTVLGQLAQLGGVTSRAQPDGTTTVSFGGVTVVSETAAEQLQTIVTGGVTSVQTGSGTPVSFGNGSVAGLLTGLNTDLPQYQSQLDSIASALATTVNTQLAAGYDAGGVSGSTNPLFTGTTAATISVNPALVSNPSLLAAALSNTAAGANDGGNAQALAELGVSATGPDAKYQNLIQSIGAAVQNANSEVTSQTSVATQASATLQAAQGVNVDAELSRMMTYQQTYEAAAKVLAADNQTIQSLIAAIG
ncbi:MAG TPA: flagellar basal body rod C-terminal domain-containing protein, partial [Acidimicrobiales bacterium]|nr:flagellar basal body rod C-terminal domain-containing protein [Acidimicrobiales bacterium]